MADRAYGTYLLVAMTLVWLTAGSLLVNLPFGFARSRTRRFSLGWILCVHAPVPLVILARLSLGVGYAWIPLLIAAAVAGQLAGGRLWQN